MKPPPWPAERLRALRGVRGWSQAQAAAAVGVHAITWNRWELGHKAPSPMARTILERLAAEPLGPQ